MQPVLSLKKLTIGYNSTCLLKDVSLTLSAGQRILLTGPSGCGKTSLLRCILGFIQPLSGAVEFEGHPVSDHRIWDLRAGAGYLPQQIEMGDITVREFLQRPFDYHANRHLAYDENRLQFLFEQFQLPAGLLNTAGSELSGGQKQRLGLISILLLRRKLLLLDEPVSSLDPDNRQIILQWLQKDTDRSVLMIAHGSELEAAAHQRIHLAPFICGAQE